MKNIVPSIAAIFICACLAACQKDLEVTPEQRDSTPDDSLTLLSQLVSFDPSATIADTAYNYYFTFDSQRRLTVIKGYGYDNNIRSFDEVSTFYYTGTDSLPFKNIHEEAGTPHLRTQFYFYDNLQRLIKDSLIHNNPSGDTATFVSSYTYLPGIIITSDRDTAFTDNNGNINHTISFEPYNGRSVTTNFEYDDNPNPLYQLSIGKTSPVLNLYSDLIYENAQKNNLTLQEIRDIPFVGDVQKTSALYTYNTAGLPVTANIYYSGNLVERIVYVYKKL